MNVWEELAKEYFERNYPESEYVDIFTEEQKDINEQKDIDKKDKIKKQKAKKKSIKGFPFILCVCILWIRIFRSSPSKKRIANPSKIIFMFDEKKQEMRKKKRESI